MKKRLSEEQIIGFLGEAEAGLPVAELCRKHAFSEASYYLWRSKFGGMIYLKLRQVGMVVNHKRVDRLYAEAGRKSEKSPDH